MGIVEEELATVEARIGKIPYTELITCHHSMVRVKIRQTEYRQLTVCCQFPDGYPHSPLLVELKSKTISDQMLGGVVRVCDQELERHTGQPQVLLLLEFVNDFLTNNPFVVCSEELNFIKRELAREGDTVKVRYKTGSIHFKACHERYFIDFKVTLPDDYPNKHVLVDIKETNFPRELVVVFTGHVTELMRQCVEPPLTRKPLDPVFVPKPSLQLAVVHLVSDCARKYPSEQCPVCGSTALPQDPKLVISDENQPDYVYRIYCGHLYHRHCIEEYLKTPPFTGGKKCVRCKQRIAHDKWNISPHIAEQRWAHQQARRREIDEVVDFLS